MCAENASEPRQSWQQNDDGTVALKSDSQLCLTAAGLTAKGSVDVIVSTCTQAPNQKWTANSSGNVVVASSGNCLDIQASNTTFSSDGNLETYKCHPNSGSNQQFKFVGDRLVDNKENFVVQAV
jgi:hypothetical protein